MSLHYQRATPDQLKIYKHTLLLLKVYNSDSISNDWTHLFFNQRFNMHDMSVKFVLYSPFALTYSSPHVQFLTFVISLSDLPVWCTLILSYFTFLMILFYFIHMWWAVRLLLFVLPEIYSTFHLYLSYYITQSSHSVGQCLAPQSSKLPQESLFDKFCNISNFKIGNNLLTNTFTILNGKIQLLQLNDSYKSFKIKCKENTLQLL